MTYIIIALKIFIIEYFILFAHEFIHYISSLILGFKCTSFYLIPFNISKENSKFKFKISPIEDSIITSRLHFDSINLGSKFQYNILLKKLRIYFFLGTCFDFILFIILFSIGVSASSYSYLILLSLIHFSISTINFFNSDGKYAIGAKEDSRIAFDIIRNYTLCGNGTISYKTKAIITDIHMEISKNLSLENFDVNNLWDFLNNISFYTNSLISYLNKDILYLHASTISFFDTLEKDFFNIKKYDYRQVEKTSISLLYYYIYRKSLNPSFVPNETISKEVFININNIYFKKLYSLFLNNTAENIEFLLNVNNMPTSFCTREGYSKLLLNLVSIYKSPK